MKTCVIIPAHNEEKKITNVIDKISSLGLDVVVVDDGSKDLTKNVARRAGAVVLQHKQRFGKGIALRTGFDYASKNNYLTVITMDADGQHDADEIPNFIKASEKENAYVVIGNRLSNPQGMPLVRLITNMFMSKIISLICHQTIPDTQCGFRLIRIEALNNIDIETEKYEIESELLIKLSKKGYRILSLPIRSIYAGERSRINPAIDAFRFIRFVIKVLLRK